MEYDIQIEDFPPEYRQIAERIGLEAALVLVEIRAGEGIYVPKPESLSRAARDRTIRAEYAAGSNYRQLARRHGLTEVWVRTIVHRSDVSPAGMDTLQEQMPLFSSLPA